MLRAVIRALSQTGCRQGLPCEGRQQSTSMPLNPKPGTSPRVRMRGVCLAILFAFALPAIADEAKPEAVPATSRIIETRRVVRGAHTVILNRVAPPVSGVAAVTAEPARQAESGAAEKRVVMVKMSVTVYDHRVTALRWITDGKEYRAFSNVDFGELGSANVEDGNTVYPMVLGIGNATAAEAEAANRGVPEEERIPSPETFSATRSEYFIAGDVPPKGDLDMLDALHVYYDGHRQEIAAAKVAREAKRAEEERAAKSKAAQPTVINFWRKKGVAEAGGGK